MKLKRGNRLCTAGIAFLSLFLVVFLLADRSHRRYTDLRLQSDSSMKQTPNHIPYTKRSANSTYQNLVPNVVHYIWFENKSIEFRFDKALSILSALKYIQPDVIYFHTNMEPYGKYFDMLKNISIFKVIHRKPPVSIIKTPHYETDYSNYDKVKILIEQGGIYLDLDVMAVRSFEDIRKKDCTVGFERDSIMCSGVISCVKNHPFLYLWLNAYYDDFQNKWGYNSGVVSSKIVQRYPGLVHVEKTRFHTSHPRELHKIWGKNTTHPWRDNYTIHTWIRLAVRQLKEALPTEESIKTMNTTYGEIARDVFYGASDLMTGATVVA